MDQAFEKIQCHCLDRGKKQGLPFPSSPWNLITELCKSAN